MVIPLLLKFHIAQQRKCIRSCAFACSFYIYLANFSLRMCRMCIRTSTRANKLISDSTSMVMHREVTTHGWRCRSSKYVCSLSLRYQRRARYLSSNRKIYSPALVALINIFISNIKASYRRSARGRTRAAPLSRRKSTGPSRFTARSLTALHLHARVDYVRVPLLSPRG